MDSSVVRQHLQIVSPRSLFVVAQPSSSDESASLQPLIAEESHIIAVFSSRSNVEGA